MTEKLFQAFQTGAIHLYYGSNNKPEPEIVNPASVIFFNMDSDNEENVSLVKDLVENKGAYEDFVNQDKFLPGAADIIMDRLEKLRAVFEKVLK